MVSVWTFGEHWIIRTTILQGGADMLGGRVLQAPRAGGAGTAGLGTAGAGARAAGVGAATTGAAARAVGAATGAAGTGAGAAPGPIVQGGSAPGDQMSARARRYLTRTSGI